MVVKRVEMMVDPMAAMMENILVDQTVDYSVGLRGVSKVGLKAASKVDCMVDVTGYC